jgi:hypothetical protein
MPYYESRRGIYPDRRDVGSGGAGRCPSSRHRGKAALRRPEFGYDRFYGPVGVDPGDVGLNYGGTLARSSGWVIAYALMATALFSVPGAILILRWGRGGRGSTVRLNGLFAIKRGECPRSLSVW